MPVIPKSEAPSVPSNTPAYIPWKLFKNYVVSLKAMSTVPHVLDNTVKPNTMAGGAWRQLTSALQFLGLIDGDKTVKDNFGRLVKFYDTPEWSAAVKEFVLPAYKKIVEGVPLERATIGQLEKAFREHGGVSNSQMYDKCSRFFLHAIQEAGVKFSSLLTMRKKSSTSGKPRTSKVKTDKAKKTPEEPEDNDDESQDDLPPPKGIRRYPLYFNGKPEGLILVPAKLDAEDIKVLTLQVDVIKASAVHK